MRRRHPDHIIDVDNELQWEKTHLEAAASMRSFDRLPPRLKQVVAETGADTNSALGWYLHYRKTLHHEDADRRAAATVTALVREVFDQHMQKASDELASKAQSGK